MGDFTDENIKASGNYLFRYHTYNTGDVYSDPNLTTHSTYIQWQQQYNPILTGAYSVTSTDYSDLIHLGYENLGFGVLRKSHTSYDPYMLFMADSGHAIDNGIGFKGSGKHEVPFDEVVVELYVWKGAKPSDLSVPVTAVIIPDVLTTASLTWTPSASNNDISKAAIDDYSISEANVLTINSGYAISTSPFENVWVFAVVADASASNNDFTTTEIQTMVITHITNGTTEGTDYHKYTNVSLQSFDGETLTNAFSNINSASITPIAADGEYNVVAVGEQAGEYVVGQMGPLPPPLPIPFTSESVPNVAQENILTRDVDGDPGYITMQNTSTGYNSATECSKFENITLPNVPGSSMKFALKRTNSASQDWGTMAMVFGNPVHDYEYNDGRNNGTIIATYSGNWFVDGNDKLTDAKMPLDTWWYYKVVVPETLGDLEWSVYSDSSRDEATLIGRKMQSELVYIAPAYKQNGRIPTQFTSTDDVWQFFFGVGWYGHTRAWAEPTFHLRNFIRT